MTILFFGIYDPNYSRNRVLRLALESQGIVVKECRTGAGWFSRLILLIKYLSVGSYDVMLVAFPGQTTVPLARLLTRRPIILDAFLSFYDSNVFDRQTVRPNSWRAVYYWRMDWLAMHLANLVLFDTQAHIEYASKEFGVRKNKFRKIFVGTDTNVFYPRENPNNDTLIVHFHGSFIPLQGVEYIVQAAKKLANEKIIFNILGSGQTYSRIRKLAQELAVKNINFMAKTAYRTLPEVIGQADICLGIFGQTPKAQRVIPNKVYEYAAMKKPIITADTPAIRELFASNDLILVKAGDPDALSEAIIRLKDPGLRNALAENSNKKFNQHATPPVLGTELKEILRQYE